MNPLKQIIIAIVFGLIVGCAIPILTDYASRPKSNSYVPERIYVKGYIEGEWLKLEVIKE